MSRQTVSALRNFTNKLIKAANVTTGAMGHDSVGGFDSLKPTAPNAPAAPPAAKSRFGDFNDEYANTGAQNAGLDTNTTLRAELPKAVPPTIASPVAKAPRTWYEALADGVGTAGSYLADPSTLYGLGGLGAGGLAGYALGNMFQDEDDDSTPWLSTLAGAGLGIPAALALQHYLGGAGGAPHAAASASAASAPTA